MGRRRGGKMRGGKKLNARDYDLDDYDLRDYDLDDYDLDYYIHYYLDYYDLVDEDDFSDGYTIFGLRRRKRMHRMRKVNKLKDYTIIGERKAMEKRNNNPSSPPPPWIELPRDVTANILRRLGPEEILDSAERVCTTWRSVCVEPSLWRVFDMKYPDIRNRTLYLYATSVCRRPVDRSQGQMIDINIRRFGSNDLLHYISQRCSTHLKKLTLESRKSITRPGLIEALENLFSLEELHLFYMSLNGPCDIEAIAASCPMLTSFTFNSRPFMRRVTCDNRLALSIAKNMPNLRRLRLVADWLNNEGLLAILDGCPNLELLDLLQCYSVDLECDLGRRCLEQVKELRGPSDFSADFDWDDRDYHFRDYDLVDEEDSTDDYSDTDCDNYSVGCCLCYEDMWSYNPYVGNSDNSFEGDCVNYRI